MLQHLVRKNFLCNVSATDRRLTLGKALLREAYEEMSREATAEGWWPVVREEAASLRMRDLFPEFHRYDAAPTTTGNCTFETLASEGLRLVAAGSSNDASSEFRQFLKGAEGDDLARAIAFCAANRFAEEPAWHFVHKDVLFKILRYWLNVAFVFGRRVTGALEALHTLLEAGEKIPDGLLREYAACCVWAGRGDWLPEGNDREKGVFFSFCRVVRSGDLGLADRILRNDPISSRPNDDMRDADNFPERVLAAMVSAVAKPDKVAKKRPADLLRGFADLACRRSMRMWTIFSYVELISRYSNWASEGWRLAMSGLPTRIEEAQNTATPRTPVVALLLAWTYNQLCAGRAAHVPTLKSVWDFGKQIAENGWVTISRLIASLLVGVYDEKAEQPYLQSIDAQGMPFLARVEPEPEWKGALAALEKAVPRQKAKGDDDPECCERLFWCLSLTDSQSGHGNLAIDNLRAALRPPLGEEDGSEDEMLDSWDLERKAIRKLMSENDLLIASVRYSSSAYGSSVRWPELMNHLCKAKNLLRRDLISGWSSKLREARPMTLVRRSCEMTTSVGEDGGITLSVPEWASEVDGDWMLRDLGGDTYAYVEIPANVRKVLNVFRTFGSGGRLTIPAEGMARAEALVKGLASTLPLAEPSAEEAENLRHVAAASKLCVRLDYSEGVFVARAAILPQPDNPHLMLDPASGPTEKIIVGAVASYVLVRDMEAERRAFEPVRKALAEFESAFDGRSIWRFDDVAMGLAALTTLKGLGDEVAPLEWVNDKRLAVTMAPKSGVKLSSQRTADEWFRVDGEFHLDDGRVMGVVTMLEAARTRVGNYVRLSDGDYVALSKAMVRELDALNAAGRRKGDGVEIVKAAIPMLDATFEGGAEGLDLPDAMAVTAKEIRSAFARKSVIPAALNAELRPYQEDGYRWLSRLAACGFGSCLADDMGLGKTIQVITLLLERAKNGPSLVVAPSSVCGNWRRELERFAPSLRPVMALEETQEPKDAKPLDVVIVSYGYILFHADAFAEATWNGLVLDEAQAIKNDASKRAKVVKRLHAKFRIAATGTPVENRLGELWSIFDFLNPGLLGPAASFTQRFTVDGKAVPELKRLVKPLILRRLKGDVLDDLPEKTEVTIPVVLGEAERTAYEGCRQFALAQLVSKAEGDEPANRMSILAELTRLRRFCCHPSLVLPGAGVPSAKMEALVDLLEGLHDGHHRALVFSQFTDYLALVRKMIDAHGWTHLYLDGSTPTLERERLVNAFQGGEGEFFLISLKAGGTGLNLTAANYVILLDPWWNPAVENQAADRAHRIGQKNPVTVYRLIASDTVEARVIELHHEKTAIAEDVLDGTSSTALSPAQLMKLFS